MTQQQEDQPSLSSLGTSVFFSKRDIVKILPFPEVTGRRKDKRNMYFHRTSKIT